MKLTTTKRVQIWLFKCVNLIIPWHRLPKHIGALNLLALRDELRTENLHNTYPSWEDQVQAETLEPVDTNSTITRNSDGLYNDLEHPYMGCAGMRFGRNIPRSETRVSSDQKLMIPNPRVVSERLLARPPDGFKPASIVNLLAAAWIQFQVHDWLQHYNSTKTHAVPLSDDDHWSEKPMKIERTKADRVMDSEDEVHPAYRNRNSESIGLALG